MLLIPNFKLSEKIQKGVTKQGKCSTSVKGLSVTEVVKEIKLERVRGELKSKKVSRDNQSKYLRLILVFM